MMTTMRSNINAMVGPQSRSFDVVIVCTGTPEQASYWQTRLSSSSSSSSRVYAVDEDWPGGAGNALGSLYAYQKAAKLAEKDGLDLSGLLEKSEISCGMYHTAGKGTRLAPLPGSEANNKPGVKLPALSSDGTSPLTILESVIRQTGVYGPSRKGRLSVFWGDQIFIPSLPIPSPSERSPYHADILCKLGNMVGDEEWEARGLSKYGLIAVGAEGEAAQVEKVSHSTALQLLSQFPEIVSVGPSLGSFSMSHQLLSILLTTFQQELSTKKGKLDSDPHLWMPLTLSRDAYLQVMTQKGVPTTQAEAHFHRMATVKASLNNNNNDMKMLGAVDIGAGGYWWDFGQLALYQQNCLKILGHNQEAQDLRAFLNIGSSEISQKNNSYALASNFSSSSTKLKNTAACAVRSLHIEADGAILVGVTARSIHAAHGSIAYNVTDSTKEGLHLEPNEVLVGIHDENGIQQLVRSRIDFDGGANWTIPFQQGQPTFEEIHTANATLNVTKVEQAKTQHAHNVWDSINTIIEQ